MIEEMYASGDYLKNNPTWHVEESLWKAQQVFQMIRRNHIAPEVVCDVGCGVGEVLKQLQIGMKESPEAAQETAFYNTPGFRCSSVRRMELASVSKMNRCSAQKDR